MKQQYLFDWKTFYSVKSHKLFPGILCFPEFFAHVISTVLNKVSFTSCPKEKFLLSSFYECLQTIIDLLFGSNCQISVLDPVDLKEKLLTFIKEKNPSIEVLLLETYLKDKDSIMKYRNNLLDTSLKYYGMKTLKDFILYLKDKDCCEEIADVSTPPPSSLQYIHLHEINNCTNLPRFIVGPNKWGPIYWNIAHTLVENVIDDNEIIHQMNCFIHILPIILPCPSCSMNYYKHVIPSTIPACKNKDQLKKLFETIHDKVTLAKLS